MNKETLTWDNIRRRARTHIYMKQGIILVILFVIGSLTTIGVAQPYSPPSTKWHTITWADGNDTWIIDVVAYSNMPWTIGDMAELHVKFDLKYASSGGELHLIVKIYKGERELGSQYAGTLSPENNEIEKTFYVFLPYMSYANFSAGQLVADNIRIEIVGYAGDKAFQDSFEYPITLYVSPSIIRAELYVNSHPYYYAVEESLEKINVSIKLYNRGPSNASSIEIDLYLDDQLLDQQWIEKILVGETRTVSFTVFTYLKPGLHVVKAIISYRLPDGSELVSSTQGIIEAYPTTSIVLEADRTVVLEQSTVNFYGRITPPNTSRIVFLEMLVGSTWRIVNATTTNELGLFNFTWRASAIPVYEDYKQYVFRVRVPVSSINENISVTSDEITITVYSKKRVVDLIADLEFSLNPSAVFQGQKINVNVTVEPRLPVCIPVKVLYYDRDVMQWVLLGEVEACNGIGNRSIRIDLAPGKYTVKARISSEYRKIESSARILEVLATPTLVIETPRVIVANKPFNITLSITPPIAKPLYGEIRIMTNNTSVYTSKVEIVNGTGVVGVKGLSEGIYTIEAFIRVNDHEVNASKTIIVTKPVITIQPKEQTVESGSMVNYTVVVSPPITDELAVSILRDGKIVDKKNIRVNESGIGLLAIKAPLEPGKYTIQVVSIDLGINTSAILNVIEVVRGLKLVLLNKTVEPGGKVYAQVNVTPLPTQALQVHLLVNISGEWVPVAFGIIDTSGSTTLSFTAPEREGEYQVKAEVPGTGMESNTETLVVTTTGSGNELLPEEAMYGIVAAAVVVGASLYMVGKRRRI